MNLQPAERLRHTMKQFFAYAAVFLALGCSLAAAQGSLGDVAREARRNKPAEPTTRVVTNDDFGAPWVPQKTESPATSGEAAKSDAGKNKAQPKKKSSAEEQAELDKQWREKISAQNEKIAILERELDVLQREGRMRSSNYYGDAGNRLRNPQKYAEDDRKSRDDMAAKQKAIDEAKTELENMREEARKAGASAS